MLLREGDWVYGFGTGVEIDDVVAADNHATFASNDTGWTLIRERVRGPGANNSNNFGFWTIDPDDQIHYVGRTDVLLAIDDEPARLVDSISPRFGVGPQSGRRSSINNRGDVAMAILTAKISVGCLAHGDRAATEACAPAGRTNNPAAQRKALGTRKTSASSTERKLSRPEKGAELRGSALFGSAPTQLGRELL